MKVSSKVECGIIALIDIDIHSQYSEAVTVLNISNRQNISAKYLEQILPSLRHANIIRSIKGAKGGYIIARSSKTITLKEIIDALDNTILSDVIFDDNEESLIKTAINERLWNEMTSFLQKIAKSVTLFDLVERYNELTAEHASEPMYYI